MQEYLTEQEQIQQIKLWIKQYAPTVVLGILLAIFVTTGWNYWQNYHTKFLVNASSLYDQMLNLRAQNNLDASNKVANKLLEEYKKTPYAPMAAFTLGRDAALKKDYPTAKKHFSWIMDNSKDSGLREIARLRTARILVNEQKPDEALALLQTIDDKHFMGLINEVRGDAYLKKNDTNQARNAYQLALNQLPNNASIRPILQMKHDNLAATQLS